MKKVIGILIVTLLISITIQGIATYESSNTISIIKKPSFQPIDVPSEWLVGADQYQTEDYQYGMVITPEYNAAQEFKPTKEDLTAVALYFFSIDAPSDIDFTVNIRESLDGIDLTTKTVAANLNDYRRGGNWVMFDFDDIDVIPEKTYYIVCSANGGVMNHSYCWFFDVDNKYDRGLAWATDELGVWGDLEDPGWDPLFVELDLCFITYFQEPPRNKGRHLYQSILEELSMIFPFLERILNL
jgi:hypothetical protein